MPCLEVVVVSLHQCAAIVPCVTRLLDRQAGFLGGVGLAVAAFELLGAACGQVRWSSPLLPLRTKQQQKLLSTRMVLQQHQQLRHNLTGNACSSASVRQHRAAVARRRTPIKPCSSMKEAQAAVAAVEEELREQAYEAGLELQTRFRVVPQQYHKVLSCNKP